MGLKDSFKGGLDALKGASMNFGTVDSPDFIGCALALKDDHFMITGTKAGTYEFNKQDISSLSVLASGGDWIKYKMVFNDKKIAIIHSFVQTNATQNGSTAKKPGLSMAPYERYFGDLL